MALYATRCFWQEQDGLSERCQVKPVRPARQGNSVYGGAAVVNSRTALSIDPGVSSEAGARKLLRALLGRHHRKRKPVDNGLGPGGIVVMTGGYVADPR